MNIPFSEDSKKFLDTLPKCDVVLGTYKVAEYKPIEPYFIEEQLCKCHYSINTKEECIISSFELNNRLQAIKICKELNKAYNKGRESR